MSHICPTCGSRWRRRAAIIDYLRRKGRAVCLAEMTFDIYGEELHQQNIHHIMRELVQDGLVERVAMYGDGKRGRGMKKFHYRIAPLAENWGHSAYPISEVERKMRA